MEFFELVERRHSVRSFTGEPVEQAAHLLFVRGLDGPPARHVLGEGGPGRDLDLELEFGDGGNGEDGDNVPSASVVSDEPEDTGVAPPSAITTTAESNVTVSSDRPP